MAGRTFVRTLFSLSAALGIFCGICPAAPWVATGPYGGDARKIVGDPHDHQHLYLGTTDGWLYQTHTTGATWERVARISQRNDLVIDSIVLDPRDARHIVIGAWVLGSPDGGIFVSHDAGVTWTSVKDMQGQSVRALAGSISNPDELVAGTLQGVFRSMDDGKTWTQITPKDSHELHEFESIAIDPANPDVIYAGTWHLPWKTTDGGKNWANIKQGIIDDSDVFSIIVDPKSPQTVYASACSGIYKSENAGEVFKKVQGIPSTARRTRVLLQDPGQPNTVFAGTTEGLFRSTDAGTKWIRTTGPEVIVNDVWVSPDDSKRMLITTDRGGVLTSSDGGDTFKPANTGFTSRQVTSILRDQSQPDKVYVGVVNDKTWGGVFESEDAGRTWTQHAAGLEGHDVLALGQAPDGTLIAGTGHGIYRLGSDGTQWSRVDTVVKVVAVPEPAPVATSESAAPPANRKLTPKQRRLEAAAEHRRELEHKRLAAAEAKRQREEAARNLGKFDGAVFSIATAGKNMIASTSLGVLVSTDDGSNWSLNRAVEEHELRYAAGGAENAVAASTSKLFSSSDGGTSWTSMPLPAGFARIAAVAVQPTGQIWIGGPAGLYVSSDKGASWKTPRNMYLSSVADVTYDDRAKRVYAMTDSADSMIFTDELPTQLVTFTRAGLHLRRVRPAGDHLLGSTNFDGIMVQPQTAASSTPAPEVTSAARP